MSLNKSKIANMFLSDVRKYPLLSKEEEKELTTKFFESRDCELRNKIICHNLRLVLKSTLGLKGWMDKAEDLIQEGNLGLMTAVDRFEPHRGVPLASYAWIWIRAFQLRYVMGNAHLVKIGTTDAQRKIFFGMDKYKKELAKHGIEASPEDVANHLKVNVKDVVEMQDRMKSIASIDAPMKASSEAGEVEGSILENVLVNKSIPQTSELFEEVDRDQKLRIVMHDFKASLTYKGRIIFERRFVKSKPDTFANIGKDLYMSRQRVQQIEAKLREKFKRHLINNDMAA